MNQSELQLGDTSILDAIQRCVSKKKYNTLVINFIMKELRTTFKSIKNRGDFKIYKDGTMNYTIMTKAQHESFSQVCYNTPEQLDQLNDIYNTLADKLNEIVGSGFVKAINAHQHPNLVVYTFPCGISMNHYTAVNKKGHAGGHLYFAFDYTTTSES